MRTQASLGLAGLGLSLIVLLSAVPAARADRDSDSHGWLGIYTQALTSELREGLDYRGDGVLVNRVVPGSPADKAGIEKGDVIVSVNMRSVDSPDKLADSAAKTRPPSRTRISTRRSRAASTRISTRRSRRASRISTRTSRAAMFPSRRRRRRLRIGERSAG